MADIVERWLWEPPGDIIERLLARSGGSGQRREAISAPAACQPRDRYYTQARRLHVKRLMRGKR